MPDEIETIDKNPKSWAAWKREAKRLQAIIDGMALAAMDSEPVAYAWVSRSGKKHLTRCEPEQWRDAVILTPLYRHAQPAPERDNVRSEHAESVRDPFRLVRQAHAEW